MIDILVPMLGRPEAAEAISRSVSDNSRVAVRVLFICSPEDKAVISACQDTGEDVMVMSRPAGRGDYPRKMNAGYKDTEGEWLLLGASDIEFKVGWDEHALAVATMGAGVIATNDMANGMVRRGRFGTHCLVNREYVLEQGSSADGPGSFIHEGYDHNFVDRELCHLAQHRGLYAFAPRAIIRHRHPNWRTAPMDDTYRKGLANFREDQNLFLERSKLWGHVGLSGIEVRASRNPRRRGR